MGKTERGVKRTCASAECQRRFYDLGKSPIICPYCGSELDLEAIAAAASGRAARPKPAANEDAVTEADTGDEALIDDDDVDDDGTVSDDAATVGVKGKDGPTDDDDDGSSDLLLDDENETDPEIDEADDGSPEDEPEK